MAENDHWPADVNMAASFFRVPTHASRSARFQNAVQSVPLGPRRRDRRERAAGDRWAVETSVEFAGRFGIGHRRSLSDDALARSVPCQDPCVVRIGGFGAWFRRGRIPPPRAQLVRSVVFSKETLSIVTLRLDPGRRYGGAEELRRSFVLSSASQRRYRFAFRFWNS